MTFLQSISHQHPQTLQVSIMDPKDFTFQDNEMLIYLKCKVCTDVFKNPMRLHRCGHTFCEICLPTERKMENKCPFCKKQIQARQVDLTASNLIADLLVRCNPKECPFKGTYEQYINNHQNSCPIKKFGGMKNWENQVRNSINMFKAPQKEGNALEIRDSVVSEAMEDENEYRRQDYLNRTIEGTRRRQIDHQKSIQILSSNQDNSHQKPLEPNRYIVVQRVRKPIQLQKFIQCIEVESNKPAKPEDQSALAFLQNYFAPRKVQSKIKSQKPKFSNIIQL